VLNLFLACSLSKLIGLRDKDEAAHGASVEGLVDECLKMVARSWSEPISESVLDELNRALQEIKKANDDQ